MFFIPIFILKFFILKFVFSKASFLDNLVHRIADDRTATTTTTTK